ncbi:ABC transporter substrate-binding protein [Kitasatospora sp. NPDC094015]|uniref:ABC transporter substrate-binding protein n=1 Tax=Kitasatospora sp. NPDC094015 TaxID=3155205 RepID=UPI003323589C
MTASTSRRCAAVATATTGILLLGACGSGAQGGKSSLHDQLPESIRKSGVILVGASYTAAPMIFRNPQSKPDGLDPDLAAALGKVLGVEFRFQDVGPFANVLPGLLDQKYDVAMSGITDTRERQQGLDKDNKQINEGVDFVDYFMAGVGLMVGKGNPAKVANLDDLCGRSVAVKKGTIHEDLATRQQKACEHQGKPLKVAPVDADADALTSLKAKRVDVYITDYPKALYNAQTLDNGQTYEVAGPQLQPRPYGIAVRKADDKLRDVLTKAVNSLVQDSTYDGILAQRQLTAGAVQNSVVNGGS